MKIVTLMALYSHIQTPLSTSPENQRKGSDELQHSSAWTCKYIYVSLSLTMQRILWKGISSLFFSFINTLQPVLRVARTINTKQVRKHRHNSKFSEAARSIQLVQNLPLKFCPNADLHPQLKSGPNFTPSNPNPGCVCFVFKSIQ